MGERETLSHATRWRFVAFLVLLVPVPVLSGFSLEPGNDPRGQTFEGRPFTDAQKVKVIDAIRRLGKLKNAQTRSCAACMGSLLLNTDQCGNARPKLCREANAQTNKENGAR